MKPTRIVLFLILLLPISLLGQEPAKWSLSTDPSVAELKSGDKVQALLKADIDPGWHLYALEQPSGGPIATTIKVTPGTSPFEITSKIESPKPIVRLDPLFTGVNGKPLETKFFADGVTFSVPLKATEDSGSDQVSLDVRFQLCNDQFCLPPRTYRVSTSSAENLNKFPVAAATAEETPAVAQLPPTGPSGPQTPTDLWPFIWLAMSLGALSLLTPCVFPMIPITVSYFTSHSAGHRSKAVKLASIYSLGIIGTFTLLGMLLAIFVGAAGINVFAANPYVNLLITAIFLLFAFNLFGAYEITVPTSVLTKLDFLTRSNEGEGSGIVGAAADGPDVHIDIVHMYVAFCGHDPCFRVAWRLANAFGGDAGILDRFCPPLLHSGTCSATRFSIAAGRRMDEFSKGRDGLSRGRGCDEIYF